ncbi:hypothetical protein ACFYXS_21710 [Streptomyces sp. NPDC002574]|uniref:MFS transporter small subunit n=1 Tax=Streptomyces sp. NPDC002574 TaxID=3364652 RepID=UPI003673E5E2
MTEPSTPPAPAATAPATGGTPDRRPLMALAWLWVGAPFAYGVYELALKLKQLFGG